MGCKKFFIASIWIFWYQVYEFCERWYMRHRWPWCINSEKKDLIAALTRWLFWGLRVCFFCNLSILRQTKPPHMWPGQWGCLQYASALWGQAFAVRGNPCSRLVCTGSTACVHPRTVHRALCTVQCMCTRLLVSCISGMRMEELDGDRHSRPVCGSDLLLSLPSTGILRPRLGIQGF